ncbi:hypothetical protein SAMN05421738_10675 [Algoriella xinjiangensis]|uniref:YopX protein domain-containing protein n=1 Tax=Algoriella xinjiangensis TaxID=684065 RepID=A0A1I4W0E4_9FLAO|nr:MULTISPECIES: hypothetical protein [Algoriella]MBO6211445.1 hypothetical protein [Algoriella sp.]SFN06991.1 hypothetical protein SAMN05421738_10675 [Algoriella xinjiangensis]VDH15772.1 Uncharacterised protein [Algoriella xinjiangensis]
MNLVKHYRLRNEKKVEGYAKEVNGVTFFKGYNEFTWHKNPLQFDTIDVGVEILDRRNRRLYTNDIVLYKVLTKPYTRKGFVVFEPNTKEFGIIDMASFHFTPFYLNDLSLFDKDRLEVISHLFTAKEKAK